jgi:hypothetical protein
MTAAAADVRGPPTLSLPTPWEWPEYGHATQQVVGYIGNGPIVGNGTPFVTLPTIGGQPNRNGFVVPALSYVRIDRLMVCMYWNPQWTQHVSPASNIVQLAYQGRPIPGYDYIVMPMPLSDQETALLDWSNIPLVFESGSGGVVTIALQSYMDTPTYTIQALASLHGWVWPKTSNQAAVGATRG